MTQMIVGLGKNNNVNLVFEVESTPIADLWLERMSIRDSWPMDNPDRFYGFNTIEEETDRAISTMQQCIDTVNAYRPIIFRSLTDITDQDTLNYLHNVFERYHGQLDQQTHEFWKSAPAEVKQALADINITVHRCESLRGGKMNPRFVCTWYGMPKTQTLDLVLQEQYGVPGVEFGGVYLNYCEIGKTATDMAYDNDHYMADEMFCPFSHYSADFRVELYTETAIEIKKRQQRTADYIRDNSDFFKRFGIESSTDVRVRPLKFKVAQLIYDHNDKDSIMSQMHENQYVHSVTIK
jgi:hypothetical protein